FFPPLSNSVQSSDIYGHVFWYLMRSEPNFIDVRPGLADSLRFTPDSLSVDFFLHPGLTWHDGHPLSAHDVVFAHRICKAPEVNWSAASWLDRITNVEALDSLTVRFTFDGRYMYQVQDAVVCYPLPEHILGDVPLGQLREHPFNRRPVGSGPFRFVSWTQDQEVVIEANPDFALGRPHLNRVTYRVIPDQTSLATQIQNGDIDVWPRFQPSFYPQLEADPDLRINSYPGRSYAYVAWNTNDPLFASKEVRQALTIAIDRGQIVDALLNGQGKVGTQPLISTIWAHDEAIEPYPFDRERAKAMLEEAGWRDTDGDGIRDKDGQPFSFTILTNADNLTRVDVLTILQQQLRDVGVAARPSTMEFNTFIERLLAHDFQAAVAGWSVGIKAELTPTFGTGEPFNFVSAENARVDSLALAAESERDRAKAKGIWSQAQREIVDQAYYSFLYQLNDMHAIDRRFQAVDMNAYGWDYNLDEWYVPEGRQKYPHVTVGASPFARSGEGGGGEPGPRGDARRSEDEVADTSGAQRGDTATRR
ncbi:MAG: ABC transporter substrate-binding protein, partial [Gemmatimonadota bacterium]